MTIVPYPKGNTRQLVSYERYISLTGNDVLVCLDAGVWEIVRYFMHTRMLWASTYYVSGNEVAYNTPSEEEMLELVSKILESEGCTMNCNDLIAAIDGIKTAIQNSGNGGNNCCPEQPQYVSDGEGGVWYGTEQPREIPTTFGGAGEFETEAAYKMARCIGANNIVAGIIVTVNGLSVYTLTSLIAGGVVVAFFVATPPLAVLLALALVSFSFVVMGLIAEYVESNRESFVCALYNSDSYSEFIAWLDGYVQQLSIELELGPFAVELTELFRSMVDTDTFNKMLSPGPLPNPINPIDCDLCLVEPDWFISVFFPGATFSETVPGTVRVFMTSEYEPGYFGGGVVYGLSALGPYRGFRLTDFRWVSAPSGLGSYADCSEVITYPSSWPLDITLIAVSSDLHSNNTGVFEFDYTPFDC